MAATTTTRVLPTPHRAPTQRAQPSAREIRREAIRQQKAEDKRRESAQAEADEAALKVLEKQSGFELVDGLLRQPRALVRLIEADTHNNAIARAFLITAWVCAALFGASLGAYRGYEQIAFAAIKFPLVLTLTAALAAPAYSAIREVILGDASLRRDFTMVLATQALASIVLAGAAPLFLAAVFNDTSYHKLILLAGSCGALAVVAGGTVFLRGFKNVPRAKRSVVLILFAIFVGIVGMQSTWVMRPYLVRPAAEDVPFVRANEGSLIEALDVSADSARGRYRRGLE